MRKLLIVILMVAPALISGSVFSQGIIPGQERNEVIETIRKLAINNLDKLSLENFSFGVSFSPAISWLNVTHNDLSTDGATVTGFIGLHAYYRLNEQFSVVSGIQAGIQGGYVYDDASLLDVTTKNNFLQNYYTLEIPLLARYTTKADNRQSFYFQGGLVPGFSLSASEFHLKSAWNYNNKLVNINDLSEIYLLSYQLGAGIKRDIWQKNAIFAEINFKSSMANLASAAGYDLAARYPLSPVPEIIGGNMIFTFGLSF